MAETEHNKSRSDLLRDLQAAPLEIKIAMTKRRIHEWIYAFGIDGVYVSFSGGKDSTVLLHLVRELYPDTPAVFADTGLEYPEIRKFVKTVENVVWLKPEMRFDQVVEKYGFPVISKEIANVVSGARNSLAKGVDSVRLQKIQGRLPPPSDGSRNSSRYNCKSYEYLLDAPFKISSACCDVMKKAPFHKFEKTSGKVPFIGTMAEESFLRTSNWLRCGCNAFNNKRQTSAPLSFWVEQDVLQYIKDNNIPYAKDIYGDIVEDNGRLKTTKANRTGCMFCAFGVHREPHPNRFERMKQTHPKQWDYIINTMGMGAVLDYIGVTYGVDDQLYLDDY